VRDILCKAKRTDNSEWVEGFFVNANKEYGRGERTAEIITMVADRICSGEYSYTEAFVVDENTISQYTGLNDGTTWNDLTQKEKQAFYNSICSKNNETIKHQNIGDVKHLWAGKMIWENDIVKATFKLNGNYAIGYVVYDKDGFKIRVTTSHNASKHSEYTDKNQTAYYIVTNFIDRGYSLKVIGNRFDNPELLFDKQEK